MSLHYKFTRSRFLHLSGLATVGATMAACVAAASSKPVSVSEAPVTNPDEALRQLLEGNQRYIINKLTHLSDRESRRLEVAQNQRPFATIFGCVDSRVPPEIIFDRGLGDLFVVRVAGQVLDDAVLGSLEFGLEELHIPLIMVLGHERCGAVKATVEIVEKNVEAPDRLGMLINSIRPAVEKVKGQSGDLLKNAVNANIELSVSQLKRVPHLAEALERGRLKIVGACYDLDTGAVEMIAS